MSTVAKNPLALLLIAIPMGVAGQILFKVGLRKIGGVDLSWDIWKIFLTPYILAGIMCYVSSTALWLSALSKVPLSYAYPMLSIGYLLVFIVSVLFLEEKYTHLKLLANILIIAGIVLLNIKPD